MVAHSAALRVRILSSAMIALAVSACQVAPITGPDPANSATASDAATHLAPHPVPAIVNEQLADVRSITARYRDLDDAKAAGYTVEVTPCLELPGIGGMGFHFGNQAYIDNPVPNHRTPELLLFEPQKNGNMQFVGVEYIIPFALVPPTATPPVVLGQEMHADAVNEIWALHAWVGRHNPTGMFEDWNPQVSCQFAP